MASERAAGACLVAAFVTLTTALTVGGCARAPEGRRVESRGAADDTLAGKATVSDGDGLVVSGRVVRLFGIDAPEVHQFCHLKDGSRWPCGQRATAELDRLTGGKPVECRIRDVDRYERAVATCRAGDVDLADRMVRSGWAVAYRRFSRDYVEAEQAAKERGAGIWQGSFEMPWRWREVERERRRPAQTERRGR